MRKKLIAGNWKMHGSCEQSAQLIQAIQSKSNSYPHIQIVILPSFIHLALARDALKNSSAAYGAQNLYLGNQGAFTGEVSGPMLKDLGCTYVLIGHSERRAIFNEGLDVVSEKFSAALVAGLTPILCIGETKAERESGLAEKVIAEQLQAVIDKAGIETFANAVIAYEPVWAIGTGLTASPAQAQEMHAYIRSHLSQINVDIAETICILYGGSMKAENALELLRQPDIDGGLIGGAALVAESFLAICDAAENIKKDN